MAAVTMAPNPVQTLQEEAVCPICLDYFTDPVSIGCGHNFCRACVTQLWGREDEEDEEEEEEEEEDEEEQAELDPEEEEEEENGGEEEAVGAAGAHGDLDVPMRDADDDGDQEEEVEEEEVGVMEAGSVGGPNWDHMHHVREEEEEDGDDDQDDDDHDDDDNNDDDDDNNDHDHGVANEEAAEEMLAEVEEEEPDLDPPRDPRLWFACPQCRKSFPTRSFRPNLQLANMVEVIRKMLPAPAPARSSRGDEQRVCPQHQEALQLFCVVDKTALCAQCRESGSHRWHSAVPLEEAVRECQAKLRGHVEPLGQRLDAVRQARARKERCVAELRSQMKAELAAVAAAFGRLTRFLAEEQAGLERRLRGMHEDRLRSAGAAVSALAEQAALVSGLLSEARERSQQGGLPPFQDVQETFDRCEEMQRRPPEIEGPDPWQPHNHDFLEDVIVRKMSRLFCQAVRVDLTLDPDTAHPALMLSPDRRLVRLAPLRPEVADSSGCFSADCCVLGNQGFRTGRHYWEVEVGGRPGWAVGAARVSGHPKELGGPGDPSADASPSPRHRRRLPGQPQAQREVWCVGTNGSHYQAQSSTEQMQLSPREKPRRFGVYLDYDAERLDIYNADTLAHVHTFSAAFLGECVFPFFRVFSKGTRIQLCP